MNKRKIKVFQEKLYSFYEIQGRHDLPWRKTKNPYRILVSEIMLQQTQVARVIEKYSTFIRLFPTIESLAEAPLKSVLEVWVGLGYNRRARFLHETAKYVVEKRKGVFPKTRRELEELPGVGPYTAGAILAFAFNTPVVLIETNIRSVFLAEFFAGQSAIEDKALVPLIEATLDTENPRAWYAALMDYGSFLKATQPNPSRKSKHHTTQANFKGSIREVRGKILSMLLVKSRTTHYLVTETGFTEGRIEQALQGLSTDNLIVKKGRIWSVVT